MFRSGRYLLLCLLWLALASAAWAQKSKAGGSFSELQNELMGLMEQQTPKVARMKETADAIWKDVEHISYRLSFPRNVAQMRDSATVALVGLRKRNDLLHYQAQELWFSWWPHNMNLMAVYTRYGELKAAGNIDDNLRMFLLKYRQMNDALGALLEVTKDIYNECDFLLNTKLN